MIPIPNYRYGACCNNCDHCYINQKYDRYSGSWDDDGNHCIKFDRDVDPTNVCDEYIEAK